MCLEINILYDLCLNLQRFIVGAEMEDFMKKLKGNFTTILNNIITDKNISGNEFKILCYLCMRSGTDNSCFPSLDTIHQDTGICLSTVKNTIPKLVESGCIIKIMLH